MMRTGDEDKGFQTGKLLTLTARDVTSYMGRSIDLKMDVDNVWVGHHYDHGWNGNELHDGWMNLLRIYDDTIAFGVSNLPKGEDRPYWAAKGFDVETTFTWSDSGEVVDLPFVHKVEDLDAKNDYYAEGWAGWNGFATFWKYPGTYLEQDDRTFRATRKATDLTGDESMTKGGLYAVSEGGWQYWTYYGGDCAYALTIYPFTSVMEWPGAPRKAGLITQ